MLLADVCGTLRAVQAHARSFVALAWLAFACAACAKDETRSLVPIDLQGPADADLDEVTAIVSQGSNELARRTLPWNVGRGETLHIGIYLPAEIAGAVDVTAIASDKGGHSFASGAPGRTTVATGKLADLVTLVLAPRTIGVSDAGDARPSGDATTTDARSEDATASDANTGVDAPSVGSGWGALKNIEEDLSAQSADPAIAIHPTQGHVLVAWREPQAIKLLRYDGTRGAWEAPKRLEDRGRLDNSSLSVVFSANGHAMLLWSQDPSAAELAGVWARRSTDGGSTWSPAVQVHKGPARYDLGAGISQTGAVRAVWQESPSLIGETAVWSAAFNPTTGMWSSAAAVAPATNRLGKDLLARLAMDPSGAGVLVFVDSTSAAQTTNRIWAVPFSGTDPLASPRLLASDQSNIGFSRPAVAVAPGGKRAAVMTVEDNAGESLWMYELDGGTWKPPLRVLSAAGLRDPALVIDATGVTTAAWTQRFATGVLNVQAARHLPGQGFGPPLALELANMADSYDSAVPRLGVDAKGNVHATWRRRAMPTGVYPIVVRSYKGNGWQPELVFNANRDSQRFSTPVLAVAESGAAALAAALSDPNPGDPDAFNVFVALYR